MTPTKAIASGGHARRAHSARPRAVDVGTGRSGVVGMRISRTVIAAVSLVLVGAVGVVQAVQQSRGWPPPVIKDADGAPVLSAEESLKTIVVPPGYRVELVAKEP